MSILLPLARDLSRKANVFVAPSVDVTIHPQCFARTIKKMKKCAVGVLCGRHCETNQALVTTQDLSLISAFLNSEFECMCGCRTCKHTQQRSTSSRIFAKQNTYFCKTKPFFRQIRNGFTLSHFRSQVNAPSDTRLYDPAFCRGCFSTNCVFDVNLHVDEIQ